MKLKRNLFRITEQLRYKYLILTKGQKKELFGITGVVAVI
jgi:NADH dehydrogenase FAD-containing subunit